MIDHGIEVKLKENKDFLKIVETLTRIGICAKNNTVTQTCHILHKQGHYYILHFKELLEMDGVSRTEIGSQDIKRRNGIVKLLVDWGLCEADLSGLETSLSSLKIVSYGDKGKYVLKSNYTIGKKKYQD